MKGSFIILLAFLAGLCSAHPPLKIVNGTDAQDGEFRFMVSIRKNVDHECGGTIINSKHILTAAHCVCNNNSPKDPEGYNIQYGSVHITRDMERTMTVQEFICNQYSEITVLYDIAIVKLTTALPMDGLWQSVSLTNTFSTVTEHEAVVVGWGRLWTSGPIPSTLQVLQVTTYEDTICGLFHNNLHHICTGATVAGGICNGDSGGALLVNGNIQVGIASFITDPCGFSSAYKPDGFARISTYYSWILDNSNL